MIDLASLENLHQGTSPGPWRIRRLQAANLSLSFVEAPRLDQSHPHDIELLGEDDTMYPTREADMEFIVAAHALVPSLIDELRRLRSLNVQRDPLEIGA